MRKSCWPIAALVVILLIHVNVVQASTKDEVEQRGYLRCGVSTGIPGFSQPDEKGNWSGLDVDICKAVAVALLGDASKVTYVSLMAKERSTALVAGEVDLLSGNTAWTLTRDSALGIHFAGISLYDRQGILVAQKDGVKNTKDLSGATICSLSGTSATEDFANDFQQKKLEFKPLALDTADNIVKAFEAGRCGAITAGVTQLHGLQTKLSNPDDVILLQENISKVAYGPAVRQGDDAWFNIVKWSLFVLINGEEMTISSANVDLMKRDSGPRVKSFLGEQESMGKGLGLSPDWAYQVIKQVGNYEEIFEKNMGMGSPLKMKRGLNELWSRGGVLYAPSPF